MANLWPLLFSTCSLILLCILPHHVLTRGLLQQQATTPPPPAGLPPPSIYFPLVDEDLSSSLPSPNAYQAIPNAISWSTQPDPLFGTVLDCEEARGSHLRIPSISPGNSNNGAFALSIWVKIRVNPGAALDYVLFQNGTATLPDTLGPSILALFIPEINNEGYGRVRAIVRDESDVLLEQEGSFPLYLDSNNCVSDGPTCTNNTVYHHPIDDGNWHLLSLTTLPQTTTTTTTTDGTSTGGTTGGYQLYVDGALVGEILPDQVYTDMLGGTHTSSGGGAPMGLAGDMYLCSRGDESAGRMMSGSLAHLMIWDQSLTADMMEELYMDFVYDGSSTGVNCTTPCRNYDGVGFCLDPMMSFVRCSSMSVAEEEEALQLQQGATTTTSDDDNGLSGGAIAGIVIGVLCGVAVIGIVAILVVKKADLKGGKWKWLPQQLLPNNGDGRFERFSEESDAVELGQRVNNFN